MKLVFALSNPGAFIFYDEVARYLAGQGHEIEIWHGPITKANITDRALQAAQSDTGTCQSQEMHASRWHHISWELRGLIDCGVYFNSAHLSPWLEKRWEQYLSPLLQKTLNIPLVRNRIFSKKAQNCLRVMERLTPLDMRIIRQLKSSKADVLMASPLIYGRSYEADYVKSAQFLGIPVVAIVQSWDNLTTKGTYHSIPDLLLVWNQPLVEEAVEIHNIPREKIVVTGAPRFDPWFATVPSCTRKDFLDKAGLNMDDQYVTYLCSSNSIAGDETEFVCDFASALSSNLNTKHLKVVVRPYPSNAKIWENISRNNIIVWPKGGDIPDTPLARSVFFDTLYYGIAVFGVNTTAFLEAAVVDKPCVTAFTGRYQRTQVESAHFKHLLRADFIEIAEGFEHAAELISRIEKGADIKASKRKNFVRDFMRPHGVEKPAAPIMGRAIEAFAMGLSVEQARSSLL